MGSINTPIRVCQLWNEYLPIFTGAAIRHNQLHPWLCKLGISVEVLTIQWPGTLPQETIDDIPIFRVPVGKQANRNLRDIVNGWRLCKAVWSRRAKFDLLYSLTSNEFHLPALLLARLLGKPVILEFNLMQSTDISLPAKILSALAYFCYRWFNAYIPISTPLMDSLIQRGLTAEKCHLIPYGVYPDEFVPLKPDARRMQREKLGLDPHATYLLFVGSLIHRKGVDILLEMMTLLGETRPDIHLLLIGQHDFPEGHAGYSFAETTKAQIQERGLSERFHLIGRLGASAVLPWMQVSDIFVFPSRREGLGRVILESMSIELPCICSLLDGIVYDMIEPEVNGIVVEQIESGVFTEQVIRLADDSALRQRLGEQARQTVVSRFDERNFASAYRTLFEDILGLNDKP